ncbi:MAG TPA: DUF3107 domain-containing protein [Candidatus Luteococcus avicola]|uniref:DUF3107 domain-containing protein n=1 Tax=Luteococcus sanguinis TaxID=174038 RepID=A0ABW1WXV6_9ACTN|nr:DUF3107 domain-containing protein [Candidatus Luteococcus avicola]
MEIKIGINNIPREVSLESDESPEVVEQRLRDALTNGELLSLTDTKGRTVLVPSNQIGYVDLGKQNTRQVGFGF